MAPCIWVLLISLTLWRVLPRFTLGTSVSYPRLLLSLAHLWRQHQTLRRAALAQGLLSVGFSAFLSTLALMLSERFYLDSAVAGAPGARWPHRWRAVSLTTSVRPE